MSELTLQLSFIEEMLEINPPRHPNVHVGLTSKDFSHRCCSNFNKTEKNTHKILGFFDFDTFLVMSVHIFSYLIKFNFSFLLLMSKFDYEKRILLLVIFFSFDFNLSTEYTRNITLPDRTRLISESKKKINLIKVMKKAFYDEKNQPQNFIVLSFLLISNLYFIIVN